ncbi:uncharacterized protein MYCGRDRAFT_104489, partial [Zymoseptoria tritici IPO323]
KTCAFFLDKRFFFLHRTSITDIDRSTPNLTNLTKPPLNPQNQPQEPQENPKKLKKASSNLRRQKGRAHLRQSRATQIQLTKAEDTHPQETLKTTPPKRQQLRKPAPKHTCDTHQAHESSRHSQQNLRITFVGT